MKELRKGSVKTLFAVAEPVGEAPGEGRFFFSDRYSVFDWGRCSTISGEGGKLYASQERTSSRSSRRWA